MKLPTTARRAHSGFSLVEILVVLVIMGLLISVVAPTVLNRADEARIQKVHADFKAIETALKIYRLDNYVYPTTEQGLDALVEASNLDPQPRNFKDGGYLPEVPLDPWGRPYLFLSPGENGEVDIYSLGADGLSGGEGQNADIGNWKEQD
ncbi:MAG TPA: type II secretion system protein GspG [Halieaceae bacterium]|jgi:general secretion pathway protein G|uniref:type II secretion system major pseudopilin GspG n=1 Tax=Haliea TaxID=475794 RepID=UPI00040C9BF9|nr:MULTISPECIES: type II secretion system major pseudopilin GspG [Haliea]HBM83402.1 type II secretion system protein GspG [Halieaceae bacterium]MAY92861.1 type II secretion system protein GspG [Haliea sp.]MBK40348.1 type II secretion system protein GspG [Haliea sp.]MBP68935.1 type II secretion system protein GspG [Haliea sp.]HBQ41548.1 type II secretion system protein GspG [Halieaceae bacterium]|tara:strand:- start:55008 stop:55457 length:450 start_codon:yes stop_codon:yes gene_type:complete